MNDGRFLEKLTSAESLPVLVAGIALGGLTVGLLLKRQVSVLTLGPRPACYTCPFLVSLVLAACNIGQVAGFTPHATSSTFQYFASQGSPPSLCCAVIGPRRARSLSPLHMLGRGTEEINVAEDEQNALKRAREEIAVLKEQLVLQSKEHQAQLSDIKGAASASAVRSTTNSGSGAGVYESERAVDEYLQFHFATPLELAPIVGPFVNKEALDFPALCARETALAAGQLLKSATTNRRALDVGCAVGRHSFELTRDFDEVVGFDFSNAFVQASNSMKTQGRRSYQALVEGVWSSGKADSMGVMENRTALLPTGIDVSKCQFVVGDACNMQDIKLAGGRALGVFDAVVAANLLCRLPDPSKFLRDMHSVVKSGGVFVLISPYSWLPEYTKKSEWLGGYTDGSGKGVLSKDQVRKALSEGFDLVSEKDMPFLIREHQRKYQIGCSHCMVFKRK